MDVLELDGKKFLKASKAARTAGYTTDYVGQLCRSGKVDAHLIGRSWYVDADQLGVHRVEKKRSSRVKAREQAKKAIKLAVQENTELDSKAHEKRFLEHAAQYESDESELIPAVRKLSIASEEPKKVVIPEEKIDTGENYTVENAGKKVLMEGSLSIIDLDDENVVSARSGETILTPTITTISQKPKTHRKPNKLEVRKVIKVENKEKSEVIEITKRGPLSFEEKLLAKEDEETTQSIEETEAVEENEGEIHAQADTAEQQVCLTGELEVAAIAPVQNNRVRYLPMIGVSVLASILLVSFSALLEVQWVYTVGFSAGESGSVISSYNVNSDDVLEKIPFKI